MDPITQSKIDAWFESSENIDELFDILELITGGNSKAEYIGSGCLAPQPNNEEFNYEILDIPKERADELCDGAKPTKEEIEAWRKLYAKDVFLNETGWQLYMIHKIKSKGTDYFLVSFQGDGGEIEDKEGPYTSIAEVYESFEGFVYERAD